MTTDAEGHYQLSGVPGGLMLLYASKTGYKQPCAATISLNKDAVLDIELVSEASSSPPAMGGSPTVSGLVFETTPEGRQPIQGAEITSEWNIGLPVATTKTDAEGGYQL